MAVDFGEYRWLFEQIVTTRDPLVYFVQTPLNEQTDAEWLRMMQVITRHCRFKK